MAKEKAPKLNDWFMHKSTCQQCKTVNSGETKTLINCCLVGAPLLRDYLNQMTAPAARKKQAALRNQFQQQGEGGVSKRATKRELAEVMRYK
jgi:hypothetical protein